MRDSPEERIKLVRNLIVLSLFNDNKNQARASYNRASEMIKKFDLSIDDIFGTPAAGPKVWSFDDFMSAAEKGQNLIALAKAALADPEVQKTTSAVRDIGSGIAKGLAALKARRAAK